SPQPLNRRSAPVQNAAYPAEADTRRLRLRRRCDRTPARRLLKRHPAEPDERPDWWTGRDPPAPAVAGATPALLPPRDPPRRLTPRPTARRPAHRAGGAPDRSARRPPVRRHRRDTAARSVPRVRASPHKGQPRHVAAPAAVPRPIVPTPAGTTRAADRRESTSCGRTAPRPAVRCRRSYRTTSTSSERRRCPAATASLNRPAAPARNAPEWHAPRAG